MAKNLKLQIKNVQIADAINLRGLKAKLSKKKEGEELETAGAPSISEDVSQQSTAETEKKKRPTKAKAKAPEEVAPAPEAKVAPVEEKQKPLEAAPIKVQEKVPEVVKAPVKTTVDEPKQPPVVAVQAKAVAEKPKQAQPPTLEKKTPAQPILPPPKPPVPEHLRLGPVMRSVPPKPAVEPRPAQDTRPSQDVRPSSPPHTRPQGQWRDVAPPRYGAHERRYNPGERPPHPSGQGYPPRPYPPREGGQGGRPPYGAPREGGYPPREGRPPYGAPREGGYPPREGFQRSDRPPYQGHGRPPYQGGENRRPPLSRPDAHPTPKPEGRTGFSEKKEFTNKEIEEGLFRRSPFTKAKPKEPTAKPLRKVDSKEFDSRIRNGLRGGDDDEEGWKRRRPTKQARHFQEQEIIRPTKITIRLPISVKDIAVEMKLKASQLISKLFMQGLVVTLNDMLDDETAVQLLGHEFGCEIIIDTKEEERIRITDKTVSEEIAASDPESLVMRPPVVAFMGHVDHGKTSLIDTIRKSNTAAHEVGAITQHIGAFRVSTAQGDIAILDTPGHEAFSHMRERGAEITDIVVLVVAGDEGMKEQTEEALKQAKASSATIVVAINKCDKPAFDAEKVYRQLADHELLPEVWGGQTITVNCSAVTGQGIPELLEMLALQSEILELRANPDSRARGTVIESEVERGLGPVATVLVQNGTLRLGDSLVFGYHFAKVKTMKDEKGHDMIEAGPSTPVRINGLSGLPESGEEFIVVKSEREAKEISQVRQEGRRSTSFQTKKRGSLESMMEQAQEGAPKKALTLILRADVQGSLEALRNALEKIESKKVEVNIISTGVGLISESDVQLAFASKAVILGFHTPIESHVESTIKELGIQVRSHDIIYHAVDDVRAMMLGLLDKVTQEKDVGKAEVKAIFKSSQLGLIAGCQVLEGTVSRNNQIRVMRDGNQLWKGPISSLKRVKEDVREVSKGAECGILLQGFSDVQQGDILEAFEVIYLTQEL